MTEDIPGGEPITVSAAVVAGLAREVEALRAKLRPLSGLNNQVRDLANTVAALADEVAGKHKKPAEPAAVTWLELRDGGEEAVSEWARGLLGEVTAWVGEVFLRYPDAVTALPECWLWHPTVIEELVWLKEAWTVAYHGDTASVRGAADWHDRYRPGVVRRIKTTTSSCSLSNHTEHTSGETTGAAGGEVVVPFAESAEQVALWWTSGRAGTGPQPSATQLEQAAARWRRQPGGRH
jgi:hypothetical protein